MKLTQREKEVLAIIGEQARKNYFEKIISRLTYPPKKELQEALKNLLKKNIIKLIKNNYIPKIEIEEDDNMLLMKSVTDEIEEIMMEREK